MPLGILGIWSHNFIDQSAHSMGDMVNIMLAIFTSQDLFLSINLGQFRLRAQVNFSNPHQWRNKSMATRPVGKYPSQVLHASQE